MAVDLKAGLTRKIGPLPAWGWAVAIGGGLLVWRFARGGSGGGSSSVIGGGGDAETPSGVSGGVSGGALGSLPIPGTIGGGGGSSKPIPVGSSPLPFPIPSPSLPIPNLGTIALPASGSITRRPLTVTVAQPIAATSKAVSTYVGRARRPSGTGVVTIPRKPINRAASAATAIVKKSSAVARRPSGDTVVAIRTNATNATRKAATAAKIAPRTVVKRATVTKPKVPAPKAVAASVQRRGTLALQ